MQSSLIYIIYDLITVITGIWLLSDFEFKKEGILKKLGETLLFSAGTVLLFYGLMYLFKANGWQEQYVSRITVVAVLYDAMRVLRHELKNDILSMEIMLKGKEYDKLEKYFGEITKSNAAILDRIECGNRVLNNILNVKKIDCNNRGIAFDAIAAGRESRDKHRQKQHPGDDGLCDGELPAAVSSLNDTDRNVQGQCRYKHVQEHGFPIQNTDPHAVCKFGDGNGVPFSLTRTSFPIINNGTITSSAKIL